jgi:hypothetical protein
MPAVPNVANILTLIVKNVRRLVKPVLKNAGK